jgi:hypothetical protein
VSAQQPEASSVRERGAAAELLEMLEDDEQVEAVVFGPWGWSGYDEPDPPPVPHELFGRVLSWDEARPYMQTWNFDGGYGAPKSYAVCIWTNRNVFWVTNYDGSTTLDSAPRHPLAHIPNMPGGG